MKTEQPIETFYLGYATRIIPFTVRRTPSGGVSKDYPYGSRFSTKAIEQFSKTPAEAKARQLEYTQNRIANLEKRLAREREKLETIKLIAV